MSDETVTQRHIMKALDWAYEKALDPNIRFLESARSLARDYQNRSDEPLENARQLIRWQVAKAGTTGFLTGMGGLLTLPLTIPADLGVLLFVQLRMIGAIAIMGGYDLNNDRVKTLCYVAMTGDAAKETLKPLGIQIGTRIAKSAISKVPGAVLVRINRAVGFRLVTKFGEKGIIKLGKGVPIVGGLIGGAIDAAWTNSVGKTARDLFLPSAEHRTETDDRAESRTWEVTCPYCESELTLEDGSGQYECPMCTEQFIV